ncbi:MAG: hypothetical protein IJ679_08850 [Lachnospiraceae bacterium]|nr:hypothetical protein [Lachnospiraceae bacterium]
MEHIDIENTLYDVFDLEKINASVGLGKMIKDVERGYELDSAHPADNFLEKISRTGRGFAARGEIIELFGDDLENIRAAQKNPEIDDEL